MSLTFTLQADDPDGTNGTSYTTAAFTPSANAGIIVATYMSGALLGAVPTLDTPTWLDGAWTQQETGATIGTVLTVFSRKTVSAPGSDDLTATIDVGLAVSCIIHVFDVTGQTVGFILQSASDSEVNKTSYSIALAALAKPQNACIGIFGNTALGVHTPENGETEIADSGVESIQLSSQFKIGDPLSLASWADVSDVIVVGLEVDTDLGLAWTAA